VADEPERWRRSNVDAPPSWLGGRPEGEELRACAFCGEVPPPASSFCPNCGRAVTAALLPQQGRAATVLFTDIEDSTHLTEHLGDLQWESIIDEHNDIVREELHQHAGFEVKLTGDGFLIVFADGMQALRCAAHVQQKVTRFADQRGASWPVRLRMGVHRGDVILRPGGDILGRTVNMAARIMAKGRGGSVVVSQALREDVGRQVRSDFWIDMGARRIRGLDRRERMYLFRWPEYMDWESGRDASVTRTPPAEDAGSDPLDTLLSQPETAGVDT
jgi:class 3 adenylate cyclase